MIGRPFRVDWRTEDTPEALKAAYLAVHRVLGCMDRGCYAQDGSSQMRPRWWGGNSESLEEGGHLVESREYCVGGMSDYLSL